MGGWLVGLIRETPQGGQMYGGMGGWMVGWSGR